MSQSESMKTGVCFMSLNGNERQAQKVMLVGCDWWLSTRLVCLACRKIVSIHVSLNATEKQTEGGRTFYMGLLGN